MSQNITKRVERIKEDHPSLDERLRQYRESRKAYDAERSTPKRTQRYRPQRGVARRYRV
jgi:hypothetical protein